MKEVYAVTGALGFLGNAIVDNLLSKGKTVRVMDIGQDKYGLLKDRDVQFFRADVCDAASMEDFFTVEDDQELIVIHAAGIVSISSKFSQLMYDVNVKGTQNIVDMALKHKIKKLVYVSTVHAIPELPKDEMIAEISDFNPDLVEGEYSKTKAIATKIVMDSVQKGLYAMVVHPSGIIGREIMRRSYDTACKRLCRGKTDSLCKRRL